MFYGVSVKPGQTVTLEPEAEVLHLSQACLADPKDGAKTYLSLDNEKGQFNLCVLQKDKCEHAALDLFLAGDSRTTFSVKGTSEVHLVGYWEPSAESDDEMDDLEGLGRELEMDSDDDETVSTMPAGMPHGLDDDIDEEFDEDDDEDDEDEDDEVEDVKPKAQPQGASSNKQKPKAAAGKPATPSAVQPVAKAQPKGKPEPKKQAGKPQPKAKPEADNKRKAEASPTAPSDKKAKSEGGDAKFHEDLVEYLTKNGRTSFSELGSKVKKPEGVPKKLAAFLKDKPTVFKVDGSHVELCK